MLEILTFTGVDGATSFPRLAELSELYPKIEFGVLVGSRTERYAEHGIFPSLYVIDDLREYATAHNISVAVHLCGEWARSVMQPTAKITSSNIFWLCEGFKRVQVNLHGDELSNERVGALPEAIINLAEAVSCERVILQHRTEWGDVPLHHDAVEYLFDRSEGAGRAAFFEWPDPSTDLPRMGYAGGIGPDTIRQAMDFVDCYSDARLWLDMEGNIRCNGLLDLDAVEKVCQVAFGSGGE